MCELHLQPTPNQIDELLLTSYHLTLQICSGVSIHQSVTQKTPSLSSILLTNKLQLPTKKLGILIMVLLADIVIQRQILQHTAMLRS